MSADEDTELRDLVAQTLESNGVLGKIRAQLRANVFLALEEQDSVKNKTPLLNKKLQAYLESDEGRAVAGLVREFLEFFRLDFSASVFEPESGCQDVFTSRTELARDLDIIESEDMGQLPLLSEVVRRSAGHVGPPTHSHPEAKPATNGTKESAADPASIHSQHSSTSHGDAAPPQLPASPQPDRKQLELLNGSDAEDDSFFDDDPKPDRAPVTSSGDKQATATVTDRSAAYEYDETSRARSPDTDRSIKDLDRKFSELGVDVPNDEDYDEDFESSKNLSTANPTPRGLSHLSPRSARSDSVAASIPEELDDDDLELDDDISDANDLLKSDNSARDDLTTDRTVSPNELSQAFDYAEQVAKP